MVPGSFNASGSSVTILLCMSISLTIFALHDFAFLMWQFYNDFRSHEEFYFVYVLVTGILF
jgi:hypothetical protein